MAVCAPGARLPTRLAAPAASALAAKRAPGVSVLATAQRDEVAPVLVRWMSTSAGAVHVMGPTTSAPMVCAALSTTRAPVRLALPVRVGPPPQHPPSKPNHHHP